MVRFGVAEDVVREDFGNFPAMCLALRARLLSDIRELSGMDSAERCERRYMRFRRIGIYSDGE